MLQPILIANQNFVIKGTTCGAVNIPQIGNLNLMSDFNLLYILNNVS